MPAGEHRLAVGPAGPQLEHADTARSAHVRLRNAFTITSRRSTSDHEHHLITAPKHGPDRAQARRAILAVLHRAAHNHHRVAFQVTLGNYAQHSLNPGRGYNPDHVLTQCQIEHHDPYTWLQRQLLSVDRTADTNAIIGVDIHSWPLTTQPARYGTLDASLIESSCVPYARRRQYYAR
jgi:hypothetical protein